MTYRSRKRWRRRIALALAVATVVVGGGAAPAAAKLDPGGAGSGAAAEPFVPGVTDFPRATVVPQPEPVSDDSAIEWGGGVPVALGAVVLAFVLGLWFGVRRPRPAAP